RSLLEGQIAELVEDEELGLGVEGELVGKLAIELSAGERTEQRGGAGEKHRVARLDDGASEGDGEVGLADAGWSEEEHILRLGDEAASGELANESLIDRGLRLEVETVEGLHRGKMSDGHAHRDALALLGVDLAAEERVEEIEVGGLAASGLREQRLEALHDVTEAQAGEILQNPCVDDGAHRVPPRTATS